MPVTFRIKPRAARKEESAWPGKVTGRDSVNATISMRTDFLVGTGGYLLAETRSPDIVLLRADPVPPRSQLHIARRARDKGWDGSHGPRPPHPLRLSCK